MYTRRRRKKNPSFFKVFLISLALSFFTMILGLYLGILFSQWKLVNVLLTLMPQNRVEQSRNVLIIGIDDVKGSSRSDSIMVVNINKSKKRVGVLSIPRDTYIEIPNHGYTKINHAYAFGGIDLVKSTVSRFLQIPIDYYLVLDMAGVKNMVDQIGGVEMDIKYRMYYVDKAGDLYIDFQPGKQQLNGQKAMSYLRYRHDHGGDIGRISRQQSFVKAVVQKMMSPLQIIKLPQVISDLSKYVKTDLTLGQMYTLALEIKDAMDDEQIAISTLPGDVVLLGGVYYWKADLSAAAKVVNETIHGFSTRNYMIQEELALTTSAGTTPDNSLALINHMDRQVSDDKTDKANRAKEEADRIKKQQEEKARLEKLAKEKEEKEKLAAQKIEKEKQEKALKVKLARDKEETEKKARLAKEKQEQEKLAREKAEKEKLAREAKEKEEQERIAAEKDEQERIAKEKEHLVKLPIFQQGTTVSIEVLNGNGEPGIASKVAGKLKARGAIVPRVGEAAHHNYQNTVVVDWKGRTEEALELAKALNINPSYIVTYYLPKKTLDITVVVGKDWDSLGN
ncbi:MAG: LCP family protein [Candidatus Margulisbacteria bacterium]|nr:LCP family protein [Candidatus Margulisiibacteriota bacterium]